ncbi:MAG: cytochrome b N-terminal domain-containing protein [Proteobacteria bacterium]|nr:cytochrome b N-terminal domain-containing protein [Pseudomonadota bacterium]MBU1058857.1 cytochrome b N-terminal domain-containing protein [Pseudomonadota bacterium]
MAAISSASDIRNTVTAILKIFREIRWGGWSLISLYISVLSGVVVALQYSPETPLYSISTMDLLVPFGAYFRSLHFYSSQLFFLFSILHLIAVFEQTQAYSTKQWIKLTATLPIALLLLFTGYILRGDSTGSSAGLIAEAILLDLPFIGQPLNDLFFSISDNGMKRIYVNHIIGLGVLWGWLAWTHIKKYMVPFTQHIPLTIATLLFSVGVAAPFDPEHLGVFHISGPWFFLGLQELLIHLHPLLAGFFFPSSFLISLALLQKKNRGYRWYMLYTLIWLLAYAILTTIGLNR